MLLKLYQFLWFVTAIAAVLTFLTMGFSAMMLVIFGFVLFGLIFMGMISVLPTISTHPASAPSAHSAKRTFAETATAHVSAVKASLTPEVELIKPHFRH